MEKRSGGILENIKNHERFRLFLVSNFIGVALLLYFVFASVLSGIAYAINGTSGRLFEFEFFSQIYYLIFAALCIFLPFFLSGIMIKRVVPFKIPFGAPEKGSSVFPVIIIALAMCVIGNYATNVFSNITDFLFNTTPTGGDISVDESNISIWTFLADIGANAIVPAFVEEFSLRGVVMQPLRRYGDKFAIVMSAVIFAIIHGNFNQIPFAFVIGLGLGYAVVRTGSIWVGVIVHFLNNAWATALQYLDYLIEERWLYSMVIFVTVAISALAIFFALRLRKKDDQIGGREALKPYRGPVSLWQRVFFLIYSPAFLIGIWYFISEAFNNFS